MKTISIIIPIYNEERTLEKILTLTNNLQFHNLQKEIICIDDSSQDSTPDILKKYSNKKGFKVLRNKENLGKSRTVKRGTSRSMGDIVVVQDADLETNPQDLIPMAKMITENKCDVVFGNRYSRKTKNRVSFQNYVGNKLLTFISNIFTLPRGLVIPDMEVCYKMMRGEIFRDIVRKLKTKTNIGIEPEMTARIAKYRIKGQKLRVRSYPIKYFPRTKEEGKTVSYFKEGPKAVAEIIRYNLFSG